jgi:antitoxin VapB
MALGIEDAEADRLARELAQRTGRSITKAIVSALREQLAREKRKAADDPHLIEDVLEIARHFSSQPILDARPADEILGYDDNGLPTGSQQG